MVNLNDNDRGSASSFKRFAEQLGDGFGGDLDINLASLLGPAEAQWLGDDGWSVISGVLRWTALTRSSLLPGATVQVASMLFYGAPGLSFRPPLRRNFVEFLFSVNRTAGYSELFPELEGFDEMVVVESMFQLHQRAHRGEALEKDCEIRSRLPSPAYAAIKVSCTAIPRCVLLVLHWTLGASYLNVPKPGN